MFCTLPYVREFIKDCDSYLAIKDGKAAAAISLYDPNTFKTKCDHIVALVFKDCFMEP
jgi:hypothetical protein